MSLTILPNDTRCLNEYDDITHSLYILLVPGIQFVSAFCSFCLIVLFLSRFLRKGYFHRNAKILISWQLTCYLVMTSIFIATNGEHLYHYWTTSDEPCSFFRLSAECTYIYHLYVLVLGSSAAIQVAMGLERVISSVYHKNYESVSSVFALAMVCATLCLGLLIQLFVLRGAQPTEFRLGCAGLPLTSGVMTTALYCMVLLCNSLSIILFIVAWRIGRKINEQNRRYELNSSYCKMEHFRLLKMFLPNVIIQVLFYAYYCFTTMIARSIYTPPSLSKGLVQKSGVGLTIFMRQNDLPHCVLLELILMHIILTRVNNTGKKFKAKISRVESKEHKEKYFEALALQWNTRS